MGTRQRRDASASTHTWDLKLGNYPNYKQVIPASATKMAVIPYDRKPGLIVWLRSLGKVQASVRLDWHKRGQLSLTHRDANGHSAPQQVSAEIHGSPPVIAFNARYLADAIEIGGALCPNDGLRPGICRHLAECFGSSCRCA